ncbi:MAG: 2-amino-4-hydroxy-6-hydroxymethyldihydropteridine diphosphokinase [Xanthobacteraceae bacterium]|nr:2-amino-4-hydroxy-6-hydroxymethyldihydropteridine diphosphokinase [Xanthobacteraceae bacterium]
MAEALLALGANVGDPRANLERGIALLCDGDLVRLQARSSDYQTRPWGLEQQPEFVNLCLIVETALTPAALLERIQEVERALGRDRAREVRWGPRQIDIDIVAYDDVVVDEPALKLPHPHLFERAFVLVPLAEIAPERIIAGTRVSDAVARIDTTGVRRLPPRLSNLV